MIVVSAKLTGRMQMIFFEYFYQIVSIPLRLVDVDLMVTFLELLCVAFRIVLVLHYPVTLFRNPF